MADTNLVSYLQESSFHFFVMIILWNKQKRDIRKSSVKSKIIKNEPINDFIKYRGKSNLVANFILFILYKKMVLQKNRF